MEINPRTMSDSVRNTTFMDILRLLMFFSVYFGQAEPQSYHDFDYNYEQYPSSIPKFLKVPQNITVHQGDLAKLRCHIYNLGPKMVVWRRYEDEFPMTVGKQTFTPDKRVEVENEKISEMESRWDLIIQDVDQSHAGVYECQISATKTYTQNITLNVLDPIEYKQEIKLEGTKYVSLMEDIHLTCNATGGEEAFDNVDWFFNGEPMIKSKPPWAGRVLELKRVPFPGRSLISELIISKASMADRGEYICRATSRLAHGIKVHVLNDMKDPPIIRELPDNKSNTGESMGSYKDNNSNNAVKRQHSYVTVVMSLCYLTYYLISW